MSHPLPLEIEPFSLARQGAEFAGTIKIDQFLRLRELVSSQQGHVEVRIEIGRETFGPVYIKGQLAAQLKLQCQRCGESMDYAINVDLKLSPVLEESQVVNVPDDYEPWVTHDAPVSVLEIVEEELLLGLPMIAKHPQEECPHSMLS
jgi:uncharacterized protein